MIQEVFINKPFSVFLKKHDNVISKLFLIVQKTKPLIPNTYKYSIKYPPLRKNFKYTDKLFIGCILYVILNNSSWISFIGPIPGKQVHKKFMEYSNNKLIDEFFQLSVKDYMIYHNHLIKTISVDSSTNFNKQCIEIEKGNSYYKNKKGIKVSAIVDSIGSPLAISTDTANIHDIKCFDKVFDNLTKNTTILNAFKRSKNNVILLADKGYDSNAIRAKINKRKINTIIKPNNRNTRREIVLQRIQIK